MGKPVTLLEHLCEHALSIDAAAIEVEHRDRRQWVYAIFGNERPERVAVTNFPGSSVDAKELRANLAAAAKKPIRRAIGGRLCILRVHASRGPDGEDVSRVTIDPAPKPDPAAAPSFTPKQGQYLAFIYHYTKIHREAPAESDIERFFRVSAPSIHEMIKTLERNGLIEKTPRQARSIRLLVRPEHLPQLE